MAEDRDELLRHYHDMRAGLLDAIAGLSDEALTEPTLDGWSVKDHLLHLSFWDEIRATEVRRISEGYESAWRMEGAQDEAVNAIAYEVRRELSLAQARWELGATRVALLDAIASASERALDPAAYGEAGLKSTHEAQHVEWIKRWRLERGL
jgi:uncharacterized damage-inducible protein DinB